jgi:(p)ppGpp synthase/HD superfamily hydrolase
MSIEDIPVPLSDRFDRALCYASMAHAGQVRKGTDRPYVGHLLAVTAIALEHGADEDEAIGALLHDAVEDSGGQARLDDIRAQFGDRVARIVEGCTDTDVTPKPPWLARKQEYIAHLRNETDRSVLLVSAADKLANSRAILNDYLETGDNVWERFSGKRDGTLWYYRELSAILGEKLDSPLARELARVVDKLIRVTAARAR